MTKRRGKLPRVELLNVPSYRQGTFDSLCAYYTAAMMLSTLFPEYTRSFGEAARTRATRNVSDDPLISYYSNEDDRLVLARWFYQGVYISRTTTILNKIMRADRRRARFACRRESAHDNTFRDVIAGSIDQGLPVMLGWNTPDYGDHAVLAPIIHDGHRISAGRAVATGLTAIFETDCRRGWRLLFGARPAAPAAWFRALGR